MLVKDAQVSLRGDYHDQPSSHLGIVEHVTGLSDVIKQLNDEDRWLMIDKNNRVI
jgi:hypothetical protein